VQHKCPIHDDLYYLYDHIIYNCDKLKEERDRLRAVVNKTDDWPTSKRNLIKRHYKEFSKLINSISLEELNAEEN